MLESLCRQSWLINTNIQKGSTDMLHRRINNSRITSKSFSSPRATRRASQRRPSVLVARPKGLKRARTLLMALVVTALFSTVFVWRVVFAATILWSSSGGSAWLTGSNWTGSAVPGGADVAQFGVNPTAATGVGINFNGTT